jgi:hypothetical protein
MLPGKPQNLGQRDIAYYDMSVESDCSELGAGEE